MSLRDAMLSQFRQPRGLMGQVAGTLMAHRLSNLVRNHWAVSLLDPQLDDQVLEIGFGPGVGIQQVACKLVGGQVWGIDHSLVMLQHARRRNQRAIAAGKVRLLHRSVSTLGSLSQVFDKIFEVDSYQFWDSPLEVLGNCRDRLRPGGTMFLVQQPRGPGATEADVGPFAEQLAGAMADIGFADILIRRKAMRPVSTLCVSGIRPAVTGPRPARS